MSKELKMKLPSRVDKIDTNEMGEFLWWSAHLGIGLEKLLLIIGKVGNSVEEVRNYIRLHHVY